MPKAILDSFSFAFITHPGRARIKGRQNAPGKVENDERARAFARRERNARKGKRYYGGAAGILKPCENPSGVPSVYQAVCMTNKLGSTRE